MKSFPILSQREWRRFSRTAWDRQPFHWRGVGPLTSSDALFRAILKVRAAVEDGLTEAQLRFFLDRVAKNEPANWLSKTDGSCDGYRTRIERQFRRREYLLVASGLQLSFELWAQLADFLRGLFSITGIPPYTVEADSFLGDYRSTAFGIHRDRVGLLMSVIEGRKLLRFWHPEALDSEEIKRHHHDYRALVKRAITIEASPGDLVYWPARFWHVGESAGYSLTLHIGLGTHGGTATNPDADGTPVERITSAVRDILVESLGDGDHASPLPLVPDRGGATRDVRHAAHIFSDAGAPYSRLAPVLVARYLNRITAVGFDPAPLARLKSDLRQGDGLRMEPECAILWQRLGRTLVVSANGHAFTAPLQPKLIGLLRRINAGATVRVQEKGSCPAASRDSKNISYAGLVDEVLMHLYRVRAMKRIRTP